jgi:Tol biopolymer transport system component
VRAAHLAPLLAVVALGPAPPPQISYVGTGTFTHYTLVLADEHGGNPVELTAGKPGMRLGDDYSWAPNGSALVYPDAAGNIDVLSANGSTLTRVASGGAAPAWSPDGRWIAFLRQHAVWLVAPDGSAEHRLHAGDPAHWSPDGTRLAGWLSGKIVGVVDAASGRVLYQTAGYEMAWSPDGTRIAIDTGNGIDVVNADGSGRRTVARNGATGAIWSPDGTRIAFTRYHCVQIFHGSCGYDLNSIYTVGADGAGERRLTGPLGGPGGTIDGYPFDLSSLPVWWPDGKQLFFTRSAGGGTYVMNADGTCEHPFVKAGTELDQEQWRPGADPTTPPLSCVDLRVRVVPERADVGLLGPARLDVTVENDGTDTATGVRLLMRLRVDRARLAPPLPSCTSGGPNIACNLDPLAPGAVRVLKVDVVRRRPAIFYVGATVFSAGSDSDPSSNAAFTVFKVWNYDLVGTIGNDRITVRPPVRSVWARAGNDHIDARDGHRETIDCGAGRDTVVADRIDRLSNCEVVHYG